MQPNFVTAQQPSPANGHGHGPHIGPDVIQPTQEHTIVRAQLHQIPPHLQHMTRPLQVISPLQLRMLVREKLMSEGIRLSAPPYTSAKVGLN